MVCLLSVLGKLVEGIIKNKTSKHIQEQVLLKENQYGFCKGTSFLANLEFSECVSIGM